MTALPIVETQAGDVSAYIPTNIISITDGQIFLESELFFAGQRPAVNVGLSVSRVGGSAQTKAMKRAVGSLRLELAQYREMEVFTQFSGDLDEATQNQLEYGKSLMALLRQKNGHPYSDIEQVILLVAGLGHVFQHMPASDIPAFAASLLDYIKASESGTCSEITASGVLSDDNRARILRACEDFRRTSAGEQK